MRRAEGRSATIVGPRGKAGTYQVRWRYAGRVWSVTVPGKADANTVRKHVHAAGCDLDAAEASRLAFETDKPRTTATTARTFALVAEDRIASMRASDLTRGQHRSKVRRVPFGNVPVHEVTPEMVEAFAADLGRTLKPSTVRQYVILVQAILAFAHDKGYRPDNPRKAIALPRKRNTRGAAITPAQYADLVASTSRPTYRALWHVMTYAGLRVGEALALQAGDVDLAGGRLFVMRSTTGNKTAHGIGEGKTANAVRTVVLPAETVDVLRPFVVGKAPTDWVFSDDDGGSRIPYQTVRFHWLTSRDRAGLPATLRMHDLRHSHASWLLNDGVPMLVVSRRLGHANIATTADLYGHIDPAGDAAVLASLASRAPSAQPTPIKAARSA